MLSVCMIVKNEADNLKLTLPQLVKHAAEVIVVDTGSTDATVETAKNLGARVLHFDWINDFAAARNYSLSFAAQPWIIWLDADEYMKEEDIEQLNRTLAKADQAVQAYEVILTESPYKQTVRGSSYSRVKVFRNNIGIHFERPINEQVADSDGGISRGESLPIVIYHWGRFLNDEKMTAKKERYFRMYREYLNQKPDDPYVNFLLGNLLRETGDPDGALRAYEKTIANCGNDHNVKVNALTRKAEFELKNGKYKESFASASQIIALEPENAAAKNIVATLLVAVGKTDMAIQVLEEHLKSKFQSVDPVREQVIPRVILADAYGKIGNSEKAEWYKEKAKELEEGLNAGPK